MGEDDDHLIDEEVGVVEVQIFDECDEDDSHDDDEDDEDSDDSHDDEVQVVEVELGIKLYMCFMDFQC